jgi:predicted nucleic acid-binding protein
MSADEVFFDTNALLYLLSDDAAKADRAESLLAQGGTTLSRTESMPPSDRRSSKI